MKHWLQFAPATRISLTYLLLASLWIILSDWLVEIIFRDPVLVNDIQTWKGQLFVAFTTLVLYLLLRAERMQLSVSEGRWKFAIDGSDLGLWDWNIPQGTVFFSPQWKKMLGYTEDEIGTGLDEWESRVHPDDLPATLREVQRHLQGESQIYISEHRVRCKDGSWKWIMDRGRVIERTASGTALRMIGTHTDLTWHKRAEADITRMAHYDALTGLPNRTLLQEHMEHALALCRRSNKPLALLFLDLDRFKNVNDSLGHSVGDQLLVAVAQRLRNTQRMQDTVARLSGDEFILLLPGTGRDGATVVAKKLVTALAVPFPVDQHELTITPSIGIALYPADASDFLSLLQASDAAMYNAKKHGRNTWQFFEPQMRAQSSRILNLENALRRALARNELSLHYQPQLDLVTGRILGCEALLRWRSPELGDVAPQDFIPIAEESGLILSIGTWVLQEAARQNKAWQEQGLPPLVMAVNLSAVQFRQANFVQNTAALLKDSGLDLQWLELELTESIMMDDPVNAARSITRLHDIGVRFAIDDFGTGYSSLSYLKRFRLHRLKIDKSFVQDILTDIDSQVIATAIIGLAHSLGLQTIAEGVENARQQAWLQAHGCNQAQGFHIAKPMPVKEFEAWMQNLPASAWSTRKETT